MLWRRAKPIEARFLEAPMTATDLGEKTLSRECGGRFGFFSDMLIGSQLNINPLET
jgi:hypothetical protein